jgi:hypothetical protein
MQEQQDQSAAATDLQRKERDLEQQRFDREFALRERELAFKEAEARRARVWNPLAIAILGASIAALGSAYVSWENNAGTLQVEKIKAESARILEVVKTGDPDKAAKNLEFLLSTGLIQDPSTANSVAAYLANRNKGEGFALPASDPFRVKGLLYEMEVEDAERAKLRECEVALAWAQVRGDEVPRAEWDAFSKQLDEYRKQLDEGKKCDLAKIESLSKKIDEAARSHPPNNAPKSP